MTRVYKQLSVSLLILLSRLFIALLLALVAMEDSDSCWWIKPRPQLWEWSGQRRFELFLVPDTTYNNVSHITMVLPHETVSRVKPRQGPHPNFLCTSVQTLQSILDTELGWIIKPRAFRSNLIRGNDWLVFTVKVLMIQFDHHPHHHHHYVELDK